MVTHQGLSIPLKNVMGMGGFLFKINGTYPPPLESQYFSTMNVDFFEKY